LFFAKPFILTSELFSLGRSRGRALSLSPTGTQPGSIKILRNQGVRRCCHVLPCVGMCLFACVSSHASLRNTWCVVYSSRSNAEMCVCVFMRVCMCERESLSLALSLICTYSLSFPLSLMRPHDSLQSDGLGFRVFLFFKTIFFFAST